MSCAQQLLQKLTKFHRLLKIIIQKTICSSTIISKSMKHASSLVQLLDEIVKKHPVQIQIVIESMNHFVATSKVSTILLPNFLLYLLIMLAPNVFAMLIKRSDAVLIKKLSYLLKMFGKVCELIHLSDKQEFFQLEKQIADMLVKQLKQLDKEKYLSIFETTTQVYEDLMRLNFFKIPQPQEQISNITTDFKQFVLDNGQVSGFMKSFIASYLPSAKTISVRISHFFCMRTVLKLTLDFVLPIRMTHKIQ